MLTNSKMRDPSNLISDGGSSRELFDSAAESLHERVDTQGERVADPADNQKLLTTRLVISDDLALEAQDDTHVTVVNNASATRLKLSRAMYQFLQAFVTPCRIEQILAANSAFQMLPLIRVLVGKHILVEADAPSGTNIGRLRTAVPYADDLARCLYAGLRNAESAHLDVVVVEAVPETGIGRAVMDRLRRAAAG